MKSKIKILVAHKFLLLRKALISLLEGIDEIEIIGEYCCTSDFTQNYNCSADILIVSLISVDPVIIKFITGLKSQNKNLKILVISEINNEKNIFNFTGTELMV